MASHYPYAMQITSLHIYPIKGCRGVPVKSVEIDRLGMVGDRRLMIVDEKNHFISQREVPALATIVPTRDADELQLESPGRAPLRLSINPSGTSRTVTVWGYTQIDAADQGDEVAAWLGAITGAKSRLVSWCERSRNLIDSEYSPRPDAETAFTDGYPLMAAMQESLDDLNSRLAEPVPMERFRPTIVVSGAKAWSEDQWAAMRLGDLECDAVKPCARCVVTTTDQQSGARSARQEPLRTLATFRTIPGLGAIFGQNLVPRHTGVLRVGDRVQLL